MKYSLHSRNDGTNVLAVENANDDGSTFLQNI